MPGVTRLGDYSTGHDDCPPTPLITASTNVFVNGVGVGRLGDTYSAHSCPVHPPHSDNIAQGSPNVFVNGIPVGRVSDSVVIGGSVARGSNNVFANS